MVTQILMPALSPTMTEGKLAKWLVAEGDTVQSGDLLAEIETDKATMELEAVDEGIIGKLIAAEGAEAVAVNTPIAVLLDENEDASAVENFNEPAPSPQEAEPATTPTPPTSPDPKLQPGSQAAPTTLPPVNDGRLFASPLARRLAADDGIDIEAITGSGPRGRIIKRDVEAAIAGRLTTPHPAVLTEEPALPVVENKHQLPALTTGQTFVEVPHSSMRQVIAGRLLESKQTIPHFYLTIDCDLDRLLDLRKDLNGRSPEGEDAYKISVNDFVIRAVALAMRKNPDVNASWTSDSMLKYDSVDVSIAVAIEGGLITPIVKNADHKGLSEIANEMKDLAGRAREGKLMPEEFQGGGFSISNLGMYGIKEFSAIINPPQACILAVGAGTQQPVVKDGALAVATVMNCTMSCDHRVVDGALGAEFLNTFKRMIEDPLTMML